MNKQDLSAQTKIPVNGLDAIFTAMGISKDLPDYTDEHLNLINAVRDIHKNEGTKSWAEAVGIYRKPINEAQLNEIAARYSMGDRVQEFMKALAFKSDSLTTEQFEQFRQVCEQVQKGMALAMVAQGILNKANAKPAATKPFPESVQNAATKAKGQGDEQAGLVVAPKVELTAPVSQFTESIPGDVREAISRFPREDAQAVVLKSPSIIADAIEDAHDATEQGLTKFVKEEWFDEYRQGVTNPDFAKQVREMLAQGKSHKKSEGSST
jgi:hypothetical protein